MDKEAFRAYEESCEEEGEQAEEEATEIPEWRRVMDQLEVTEALVAEIANAMPIYLHLVYHQQFHVWIGEPGSGKTAKATEAAGELARSGYEVIYMNLDASAPDLKHYQRRAAEDGYRIFAPMQQGMSEETCQRVVKQMADSDSDLSNVVLILDTIKKFTDMVSKSSKEFFKTLRAITLRGGTVIALGHANKYRDAEDRLIYEGTGDLRADCDNMTLLYHSVDEVSRLQTVCTKSSNADGGKMRAHIKDITFTIHMDTRAVRTESEYSDVKESEARRRKESEDEEFISTIKDILKDGPFTQKDLAEKCKEAHIPIRTFRRLDKAYSNVHWGKEKRFDCKGYQYFVSG